MAEVPLVYGTTEGHTAKVASFIADAGRRAGHHVDLVQAAATGEDVDVARYDAILVGASVHEGRHQKYVCDWIREHRAALEKVPSAFFQVSLTSVTQDEGHEHEAQKLVETMSFATLRPTALAAREGVRAASRGGSRRLAVDPPPPAPYRFPG